MRKSIFELDPEWIISERAYGPGYEPKPVSPEPQHYAESTIPWDDLWRETNFLVLAFGVISLVFMIALQIIIAFYLYSNFLDLIKGNIIAATIIKLCCADA